MIPHHHGAAEVARALCANVDAFIPAYFPNARRRGSRWVIGDRYGAKGQSLSIYRRGRRAGHWTDYATGEYGDVLDLLCSRFGVDIREGLEVARKWLGMPDQIRVAAEASQTKVSESDDNDIERRLYWPRRTWREAQSITGTLAEKYLRSTRCIDLSEWPATVRFHPRLLYREDDHPDLWFPGIVLPVQQADGSFCGIWRTFLDFKTADNRRRRTAPRSRSDPWRLCATDADL